MAKPIPHYRRNYKAGHEGQTAHELLTTVLLAGLQRVAKDGDFETYGELFREVDFLLNANNVPTSKEEAERRVRAASEE